MSATFTVIYHRLDSSRKLDMHLVPTTNSGQGTMTVPLKQRCHGGSERLSNLSEAIQWQAAEPDVIAFAI